MGEILSMFSAKGAAFNQAWGNAPGFVEIQDISAESATQHLFSEIVWGDALRLRLNGAFGAKCVGTISTHPRIARSFASDQEERAQRSKHRCLRIALRERDRPDGSPRSTRFHSRESGTANATATS